MMDNQKYTNWIQMNVKIVNITIFVQIVIYEGLFVLKRKEKYVNGIQI